MKEFRDKVAVITGAASGIGRALARYCAARNVNVVLADIEREALAVTAAELRAGGASVLAVPADVSKTEDVERIAVKTLDRFGAVHLLFNNAGVAVVGPRVWETTIADWQWVVGVNLSGVAHALRVFVPIMLDHGVDGHVVNIASAAGLVSPPGIGSYSAGKAGIIALSETLHHELSLERARIKVSVACPGLVNTRMPDSARNRPQALQNDPELEAVRNACHAEERQALREATERAMSAEEFAERVFDAIRQEQLFVFTHDWVKQALNQRIREVLDEGCPRVARWEEFPA